MSNAPAGAVTVQEPPAKLQPGQRHPQQTRDLAQTLYSQGIAASIVAAQVGVNVRTVETWARRGCWRIIRAEVTQNRARAVNTVISGSLTAASKAVREGLAEEIQEQVSTLRRKPIRRPEELATKDGKQGRTAVARALVDAANTLFGWEEESKIGLIVPMVGADIIDVTPADCGSQDTTGSSAGMIPETSTPQLMETVADKPEPPAVN